MGWEEGRVGGYVENMGVVGRRPRTSSRSGGTLDLPGLSHHKSCGTWFLHDGIHQNRVTRAVYRFGCGAVVSSSWWNSCIFWVKIQYESKERLQLI